MTLRGEADIVNEPPQGAPGAMPPAGWYPDPHSGRPRWWDGSAWGPLAPDAGGVTPGTRTALSVVSHLGLFVFAILAPLVIYLTVGKEDEGVRHHSLEALNFQITILALWLVGFAVFAMGMVASISTNTAEPAAAMFIVFFALFATHAVAAIMAIYAAVQAGRERLWRYPISIRLVGRGRQSAG